MLNISLQDFLSLFNGHWCDWDGVYGAQCFDLAQFWNCVLGGQPFTGATADLIYNQPQDIYEQVQNTPSGVPQLGDIVVWNWPHVGVSTGKGDTNTFEVLEQNDPTNGSCQLKTYNYDGVIGWLHPKSLPQNMQSMIDDLRKARDDNFNLYQTEVSKNTDLTNQFQQEQKNNQDLRAANDSITKADADLGAQLLDAQHKTQSLQADIDIIAANVGLVAPYTFDDIVKTIEALKKPHDELVKQVQPTLEAAMAAATYKRVPAQVTFLDQVKGWLSWLKL